jgi:hypothetical protein
VNTKFFKSADARALLAAFAVMILMLGSFIAGKMYWDITETLCIATVIAGLVVYGIVSGRLTEFSAVGISAKLTNAGNAQIEPSSVPLKSDMPAMDNLRKGDLTELRAYLPKLRENHPVVFSVRIGLNSSNNLQALKEHLEGLGRFRSFRFVLFVDQNNALDCLRQ